MKKKAKEESPIKKVLVVYKDGEVSEAFRSMVRKEVGDILVKPVHYGLIEDEFEQFKGQAQIIICMPEVADLIDEIKKHLKYETRFVALKKDKDMGVLLRPVVKELTKSFV